MSVTLTIASQALNHPDDSRWYALGGPQDLEAHRAFHDIEFVLSHYVGIPSYDVDMVAGVVGALQVALSRCPDTSKLMANCVGRYEEYRIKLEA